MFCDDDDDDETNKRGRRRGQNRTIGTTARPGDFQCNDHEMCDEEEDVISEGDDASDEKDDELYSSFRIEHQTP